MAKLYTEGGYLADDAALRAVACVKTIRRLAAVNAAVRCVYLPWLEDTARHFKNVWQAMTCRRLVSKKPSKPMRANVSYSLMDCGLMSDSDLRQWPEKARLEVSAGLAMGGATHGNGNSQAGDPRRLQVSSVAIG